MADDDSANVHYVRRNLKWNGWGAVGEDFDLGEREEAFWSWVAEELGSDELEVSEPVSLDDSPLPESRLDDEIADALRGIVGDEHLKTGRFERLFHAVGKSYRDLVRIRRGMVEDAPDAIVYPGSTDEVSRVLAYCADQDVVVVPYGGGSSVVGGVEVIRGEDDRALITLDTTRLREIVSIDELALTATVQAGIYGPPLEEALQERGYTLGHYPQSFRYSTLGGWIAARGAGQQSNGYGVASKWLRAATVVSPMGVVKTKPFPNSAAGPDLNQLIAGSEGTIGVITEATVQLHEQPASQDYRAYFFRDFVTGATAIREIVQREISVAMLRLSDADETMFLSKFSSVGKRTGTLRQLMDKALSATGYGDNACTLMIGCEGERADVAWAVTQTTAICVKHGALPLGTSIGKKWYEGRFKMPYLRDPLLDRNIGVDTLETATTWDNVHHLHQVVGDAIQSSIRETTGREGIVMCHISHSYLTGASLYFTFVFPMDRADPLGQWHTIKNQAGDAIRANDGTISHHHGIGVDHIQWMNDEKGARSIDILRAVRKELDPRDIMNPGKTY